MTVTVMFRDGWTRYPVAVEIAGTCPVCGGPRGEPRGHNFYEDGDTFHVNVWDNPCGHVDRYPDVIAEARARKEQHQ
jgi:hypothetical protein